MQQFGAALFSIIIIDLLLSGDNAVVIGMAVRGLPQSQKRQAILVGGAGAIALRIVLTMLAALLLQVPLLQAAGGLVLAWITYRLLQPGAQSGPEDGAAEITFGVALRTIIIADLTMSLDNMLAVGAAAQGDLLLLLIGLVLSMGILLVGGALVSSLLERLPWLIYLGAGVLLIVAGELMAADPIVSHLVGESPWHQWIAAGALGLIVALALWLHERRAAGRPRATGAAPAESDILKV